MVTKMEHLHLHLSLVMVLGEEAPRHQPDDAKREAYWLLQFTCSSNLACAEAEILWILQLWACICFVQEG